MMKDHTELLYKCSAGLVYRFFFLFFFFYIECERKERQSVKKGEIRSQQHIFQTYTYRYENESRRID